ncbi:hypothetical protein EDEG_00145 [Edhazardia aedis USNM 41457]|uniref:Uncharacterized protein n=1 Tax=Edhazardia aedis (strain USNM 41457) TaxID=1003232 RepID=J9D9P5_EDHAE|nr:hypothetical protein EDEG_00145 [Edhazardia aedis USNM 41457]|eukprot:EJW04229.1 hypothetical protein EDEG_00145 [Edhazardia aedis USNM 41457]
MREDYKFYPVTMNATQKNIKHINMVLTQHNDSNTLNYSSKIDAKNNSCMMNSKLNNCMKSKNQPKPVLIYTPIKILDSSLPSNGAKRLVMPLNGPSTVFVNKGHSVYHIDTVNGDARNHRVYITTTPLSVNPFYLYINNIKSYFGSNTKHFKCIESDFLTKYCIFYSDICII